MLAWHFVGDTLRDKSPIPEDNFTLKVNPSMLKLCEYGLHASINILDALRYAPGTTVCRVKLSGKIIKDTDKLVASERTIIWRLDVKTIIHKFACDCALDVQHLWEMPDVVKQYLTTRNESIRHKARAYYAADAAYYAADAAASAAYYAAKRKQKLEEYNTKLEELITNEHQH